MKTEPVLLGKHLNMATRARRRWLVAMVYGWLALFFVAWFYFYAISDYGNAQIVASLCLILVMVPLIAFWGITGDMLARGDEREMHQRDHAHFMAYRFLGSVTVAALFAAFQLGPHPIIPAPGPLLRAILYQLPSALLMAALFLYISLPQAILLWTEPDVETDAGALRR